MASTRVVVGRGALLLALVLLVVLTAWSLVAQPTPTLLGHLPQQGAWIHQVPAEDQGRSWWRIHLRLDDDLRRGPAWRLIGGDEETAYALEWIPSDFVWRLVRSGPGPKLLAQGIVDQQPRQVVLSRHGEVIRVHVDDQELVAVIDLLALPPARQWSLETSYLPSDASIDVHDDGYLAPHLSPGEELDERDATAAAIAQVRRSIGAIITDTEPDDDAISQSLNQAAATVHNMPIDESFRAQMAAWLSWSYGTSIIANASPYEHRGIEPAIEQIRQLAGFEDPPPLAPGLLLDLLDQLAARALHEPEQPELAGSFAEERSQVLESSLVVGDLALSIGQGPRAAALGLGLSEADRFDLLLSGHIARILSGREPAPAPAEAPAWMANHWRAISGAEPVASPRPELPQEWPQRPWASSIRDRMLAAARLQPWPAVRLRAEVLSTPRETLLERSAGWLGDEQIDGRSRKLLSALLALHGGVPLKEAVDLLATAPEGTTALAERDPLAYALYRLLLYRNRNDVSPDDHVLGFRLPPGLTPHQRLLSGTDEALVIAFDQPGDNLPPSQAVAAALALQEISGLDVTWELLRTLPDLTLPLDLMVPPRRQPVSPYTVP